jgi:hypothetical protein
LIGAFHDRLGHSGVNQTLAVMHQHYHWSGMKADISAFVRQCQPCQVRHLELHHAAEVRLPRLSCPFQHVHIDLAGPFPLRQLSAPAGRGSHDRTKTALFTTVVGSAFICLVVDYFTKAAEFLFLPDETALSVAKVLHDGWPMRYGLPEWLTSDNGTEFQGAFRHQLERLSIEHVLTSSYHPQSNRAAERLVQSVNAMLYAKVANAMHDWRSLLPTIRMECTQRRHSVPGHSPNEQTFATEVRLPPPIGALHWAAQAAAVAGTVPAPSDPLPQTTVYYLATHVHRAQQLFQTVHDSILQAQRRNAARQTTRRAGRCTRGRALAFGDLAYLLRKKSEIKTDASGPFVVCDVSDWHVELRTSNAVQGQAVNQFKVHKDQVARCTSLTDVLEDLLKHAGMLPQSLDEGQPN